MRGHGNSAREAQLDRENRGGRCMLLPTIAQRELWASVLSFASSLQQWWCSGNPYLLCRQSLWTAAQISCSKKQMFGKMCDAVSMIFWDSPCQSTPPNASWNMNSSSRTWNNGCHRFVVGIEFYLASFSIGEAFSFINYTVGPSEMIFLLRNCSKDIVYKRLTFKWPSCSITVVRGYLKPQAIFTFNCALLFSIVAECFSQFN